MASRRAKMLGDSPIIWSDESEWVLQARQERSRLTTRKILEAALQLFMRKGYEGTTVAEIATLAKIAPGSIYRRFPDKDAVLYAVTDSYYATRIGEFDELVASRFAKARTREDVLELYNRVIFSAYRNDGGMIRLIERRALVDASMRRKMLQSNRYVSDAIAACLARHDPRPPEFLRDRMAKWHNVLHGALVMTLLADDGEPASPLSVSDPRFESDMLSLLKAWFAPDRPAGWPDPAAECSAGRSI